MNSINWKVLATVFLLASTAALAQLNESDSIRWQMKYSATGSLLRGIVSRTLFVNRLEIAHATNVVGFSTRTDYSYGQTFDKPTEDDLVSFNFLYLLPLKRLYPYAMLLVETNQRRRITKRVQPGLGLSYNIIHRTDHMLKISLTGSYEQSVYGANDFENYNSNGANEITTWRATGRIYGKHKIANNKLRLFYEFWFQESLERSALFRYHTEDGIEVALSKRFAFRSTFRYTYENVELVGNKPYDLSWTLGLSVSNL